MKYPCIRFFTNTFSCEHTDTKIQYHTSFGGYPANASDNAANEHTGTDACTG